VVAPIPEEEQNVTQSAAQALFEKMSRQHNQLEHTWSGLRESLNRARIDHPAVERQLQELKRQLEEHFQFEEADGYFDEVVAKAPHLQRQADELRGQHAELLCAVASLQADAKRLAAEPVQLAAVRGLFEEISKTFQDHEAAEGRLLEDAYCRDSTAVD
jgi:hemerythrin